MRLVWYVDAEAQMVVVHQSPESSTTLGPSDSLDGGDVLPGFTLRVDALFARVDRG